MAGEVYGKVKDNAKVEGIPEVIKRSRKYQRDLSDKQNWWQLRPLLTVPVEPIPLDKHGNEMRWCSGGHYAPRSEFNKRAARRDGLDDYCKDCRSVQRAKHRATAAAHVVMRA